MAVKQKRQAKIDLLLVAVLSSPVYLSADLAGLSLGVSVNEENLRRIASTSWEYAYASDNQLAADDFLPH